MQEGARLNKIINLSLIGSSTMAISLLISSGTGYAQFVWTGAIDGDWSIGGNWNGGNAPSTTDTATFNGSVGFAPYIDAATVEVDTIHSTMPHNLEIRNSSNLTVQNGFNSDYVKVTNGSTVVANVSYIGSMDLLGGSKYTTNTLHAFGYRAPAINTINIAGAGTELNVGGILMFRSDFNNEPRQMTVNIDDGAAVKSAHGIIGNMQGLNPVQNQVSLQQPTVDFQMSGVGTDWTMAGNLEVGLAAFVNLSILNSDVEENVAKTTLSIRDGASLNTNTSSIGGYAALGNAGSSTLTIDDVERQRRVVSNQTTVNVSDAGSQFSGTGQMKINGFGQTGLPNRIVFNDPLDHDSLDLDYNLSTNINVTNGGLINSANLLVGKVANITYDMSGLTAAQSVDLDVNLNTNIHISGRNSRWINTGDTIIGEMGSHTRTAGVGQINVNAVSTTNLHLDDGALFETSGDLKLAESAGSKASLIIGAQDGSTARSPGSIKASEIIFGAGEGSVILNHTAMDYNFDANIANGLSGSGRIYQLNGRSIFTQDSSAFNGETQVSNGFLKIQGSLFGNTSIGANGTIEGTGTLFNVNNAGKLSPGQASDATSSLTDRIGTLNIAGDYTGAGGTVMIDAVLGGDGSLSDRVKIAGNSLGRSQIAVNNIAGIGAPTNEGIKVIEIDGTSDGVFSLEGDYRRNGENHIVAGAYAYRLLKNGIATPADGDWYLRSASEDGTPVYQPGTALYQSYPQTLLALSQLPAFRDRRGDQISGHNDNHSKNAVSQDDATDINYGFWSRLDVERQRIAGRSQTVSSEYTQIYTRLSAGVDLPIYEGENAQIAAGLNLSHINSLTKVTSDFGNGDIETDGYGIGSSLTWQDHNGAYLDTQAHLKWFDSDFASHLTDALLARDIDAASYAVSIEGGRKLQLRPGLSVTPQAQLSYTGLDADQFGDRFNATVTSDGAKSVLGRIGAVLDHQSQWQTDQGYSDQLNLSVSANFYTDFSGDTSVDVSGVNFKQETPRNWLSVGVGGTYTVGPAQKTALFWQTNVDTNLSDIGDSHKVNGKIGLRVIW
jgi:outer membrane autotransporter protein